MRELYAEGALDEDGRVASDLPCRGCGYILRGLAADTVCPECSFAVEPSLRGDLLVFASPTWLARVLLGLRIALIAMAVYLASSVILTLIGLVTAFSGGPVDATMVTFAVSMITSVATVIGVWLATTRDPGQVKRERVLSARRLARACLTVQLAATPIVMSGVSGMIGNAATTLGPTTFLLMAFGWLLGAVVLVGHLAGLVYLRRFAGRIPAPRLAKQFLMVLWGAAIFMGSGRLLNIFFIAMFQFGPPNSFGSWIFPLGIASYVATLGSLAVGIWALIAIGLTIRRAKRAR